jgi:hypothetical protein
MSVAPKEARGASNWVEGPPNGQAGELALALSLCSEKCQGPSLTSTTITWHQLQSQQTETEL